MPRPFPLGVIGVIGTALSCVGLLDLLLLWTPLRFGVVEWEFATISRFLDGLPVATMGIGILIVWSTVEGRRGLLWAIGVASILLMAVIVAATLVYGLAIPIALKATDQVLLLGLKKAVVKTLGEAVVYALTYFAFGIAAIRAARSAR